MLGFRAVSSSRSARVLAGACALGVLLAAPSVHAADKRAEAAAKAALKRASSDYLATNYEAAADKLQKALRICGTRKCTKGTRAALLRDLGTMQFRNGDVGAAKKSWADALALQPDLALNADYDSADLHAAFDEARGGGQGPMGEQPQGDFQHTPAAEQQVNTPLPVYVEGGSSSVVRVVVKYKGAAMSDWAKVDLKKAGSGFGGVIPCGAVTKGVLRYWVQGFDDGGDPAASSGDPKHPFTVPIKDDLDGDPPHLPGQAAPKSCGEDTECPPGLPGCAAEESSKGGGEGGGGGGDESGSEAATEPVAPGSYAKLWFGLAGAIDLLSLPAAQDVCHLDPNTAKPGNTAGYYCTNPDGSDFPNRNDGGAQNGTLRQGRSGNVPGGFQLGDVRVMVSFDYALSPSILVGGRFGYVANAYTGKAAASDGKAFSAPLHLELRGTYLFGDKPLAHVGWAPMALAGLGAAEFDGHTNTVVNTTTTFPVSAWLTDGPLFFLLGGGGRYAFSPRAAFTMALRVNLAMGNGVLVTYGPELGIQYGF